jgi:hypothetical protein
MKIKKSEIIKIIKETLNSHKKNNKSLIKESREFEYDLKNLGGGWNGDVYVTFDNPFSKNKDTIRVSLGLYSGGNQKYHTYQLPKEISDLVKKRHDNGPEGIAAENRIQQIVKDIDLSVSEQVKDLLSKFDAQIEKTINRALRKNLKINTKKNKLEEKIDLTKTGKSFANWVANNTQKISDLYKKYSKSEEFNKELIEMLKKVKQEGFNVSDDYINKLISQISTLTPLKAFQRIMNAFLDGAGVGLSDFRQKR